MTRNDLISRVAAQHLKQELDNEQSGSLRFCMIGLDTLVPTIANAVLTDRELRDVVVVRIPRELAGDEQLPRGVVTDEAAAHWRNTPLPEGRRAILFAVSNDELQRIGKTAETLPKLETDRLRRLYDLWIEAAGLGGDGLQPKERQQLLVALDAVNRVHGARTLEQFAELVLATTTRIDAGDPVTRAFDAALPALHLPSNAGGFDQIAEAKRTQVGEWSWRLRQLHNKVRPLLVRENEKGESIEGELRGNLHAVRDDLDAQEIATVDAFLEADLAPDQWAQEQEDLARLDWERIKTVFEGARRQAQSLGDLTVRFFDEEYPDELDPDDRGLLQRTLSPRTPKDPPDGVVDFYERNRERLAENHSLHRQWEKLIYRNPQTYADFLDGLVATLYRLRERAERSNFSVRPKLGVRIPSAEQKSFWRKKNPAVMRYFAQRHHGLTAALGERVELEFGRLATYYLDSVDDELARVTTKSKEAVSLKFEVVFDPDGANEKMIFHWSMPHRALATALPEDLRRLANPREAHVLLATARVARQSVSAKGYIQRVALEDRNTLHDVDNSNNGALVAPNRSDSELYAQFRDALKEARTDGLVSTVGAERIANAFERFAEHYSAAVRAWINPNGQGIAHSAFQSQAEAYGDLIGTLAEYADNDVCHERLWASVLRLGVANVGGGTQAAIVTPWQPLRLAELHVKARQTGELLTAALDAEDDDIKNADLYFAQRRRELTSSYYPEVCVGFDETGAALLSVTQTHADYTLAEPPHRKAAGAENALDVDPEAAAGAFAQVGQQYLDLLPHEKSNFAVALYNSDSKALPKAIASELSTKVEQENELRCDLLLSHTDPERMRRTYEQQNMAVSQGGAGAASSEAAQNFLSRLRVGFLDTTSIPQDGTARAVDLVFLHDVVARNAEIEWKPAPGQTRPSLDVHVPARYSRRRPVDRGETSSAVYLTAPVQPEVGQRYLNALHRVTEGGDIGFTDVVPAREISYRDGTVSEVFRETHAMGEWVVNFDELVDRRLLEQKDIEVIRHIHDRNLDRNVVISTKSDHRLLKNLLDKRLQAIDPGLDLDSRHGLVDQLIREASRLSGQVVMRAARFGHYANELVGVVLSMERIKAALECANPRHLGWYFLDDFATWFGQKEEQIADILAIVPQERDGAPILKLAISEAKFVSADGHQKHKKTSSHQLFQTAQRVSRALDPERQRIDREVWLHRIGDLMIEAMEPFDDQPVAGWDLQEWSEAVREGRVPIQVVGFSHVFIHDEAAPVDSGAPVPLRGLPHCWQIVIDRGSVRADLRRFAGLEGGLVELPESDDEIWPSALTAPARSAKPGTAPVADDAAPERSKSVEFGGSESSSHWSSIPAAQSAESDPEIEDETDSVPASESGPGLSGAEAHTPTEPPDVQTSGAEHDGLLDAVSCSWPSQALRDWVLSGQPDSFATDADRDWLEHIERTLRRALRGYGMTAEISRASTLTPNAALVRFRGSDDLTVPKVEKKRGELLTSHGFNVINVLSAPREVVIMVARDRRAKLRMRDLWRKRRLPPSAPHSNQSLLVGAKEEDGELLYLNLGDAFEGLQAHGPHTLIAGETGSGKGVLVQNLLLDLCATNAPATARIRMIDPKAGIDYPWLRRMPHLDGELITEQDAAVTALQELVTEMERRNRLLAEAGVSKLSQYNKRVAPEHQLPMIFLFHDELADWMLIDEYRDAVETNVVRLGVKARAAGIRLLLITQRPDNQALPMQLRANCTNRLALKVADKKNSEIALDESGAERLLGAGHLAAKLSGEGRVIQTQVPYIDEDEAVELGHTIVSAWRGET